MRKQLITTRSGQHLEKPIEKQKPKHDVKLVIEQSYEANRLHSEFDYPRDQFWREDFKDIVKTKSKAMQDVLQKVQQVANTCTTVLLSGETGTGKTLIARLLHAHSNRKEDPFISVHCGAIPDTLVESELFGHEKGAFTGAFRRKLGKFELANMGTLFLDEVGTISSAVQVKLLDVLQERQIQRIGGETTIPLNVRVIAASNDNLDELCAKGSFRRDLFYRLNVFPIVIPPLRERKEDILHLCTEFITQFNTPLNKNITDIAPEVMEAFLDYQWPGNVRELENIIERACILEPTSMLRPSSFPIEFFKNNFGQHPVDIDASLPLGLARQTAIDVFEVAYLTRLLERYEGIIKDTAKGAEISTRQLNKLMKKHTLSRHDFTSK
ncbi:sigma-54-dependent Fis family transcriptional regulator [Maridesulfovibrio ferrireducens]|uniref:sigma-54 interaction domain-containing protein n=1 Tax=Maridesulfovibrio ferrireducens TaxID=246191 RepID=UPI001A2F47D2|nr:sigma-54 dependent transcriptional regulator [Maridesulfovibrio ferrireducens]MBI9109598.1 sigma-54-dependent Fis family transcriptional regulator [Maridesulfovibrio ferrireducens]